MPVTSATDVLARKTQIVVDSAILPWPKGRRSRMSDIRRVPSTRCLGDSKGCSPFENHYPTSRNEADGRLWRPEEASSQPALRFERTHSRRFSTCSNNYASGKPLTRTRRRVATVTFEFPRWSGSLVTARLGKIEGEIASLQPKLDDICSWERDVA